MKMKNKNRFNMFKNTKSRMFEFNKNQISKNKKWRMNSDHF